jgi:hypothetical protein
MSTQCTRRKVVKFLKETHSSVKSDTEGLEGRLLKYLKATIKTTEKVLSGSEETSTDVLLHAFIRITSLASICEEELEEGEDAVRKLLDQYKCTLGDAFVRFQNPAALDLIEAMQQCIADREDHASPLRCLSDLVLLQGTQCRSDATDRDYTLQEFVSEEDCKLMVAKSSTEPAYERFVHMFPLNVHALRLALFSIVAEIADAQQMDQSSVFKLMTDATYAPMWKKVGERVWDRSDADFWDVVVSDLSYDKHVVKSSVSMLLFFTYYEVVKGTEPRAAAVPVKEDEQMLEPDPEPTIKQEEEVEVVDVEDGPELIEVKEEPVLEEEEKPEPTNSKLHAWIEANKDIKNIPPLFTKLKV